MRLGIVLRLELLDRMVLMSLARRREDQNQRIYRVKCTIRSQCLDLGPLLLYNSVESGAILQDLQRGDFIDRLTPPASLLSEQRNHQWILNNNL